MFNSSIVFIVFSKINKLCCAGERDFFPAQTREEDDYLRGGLLLDVGINTVHGASASHSPLPRRIVAFYKRKAFLTEQDVLYTINHCKISPRSSRWATAQCFIV